MRTFPLALFALVLGCSSAASTEDGTGGGGAPAFGIGGGSGASAGARSSGTGGAPGVGGGATMAGAGGSGTSLGGNAGTGGGAPVGTGGAPVGTGGAPVGGGGATVGTGGAPVGPVGGGGAPVGAGGSPAGGGGAPGTGGAPSTGGTSGAGGDPGVGGSSSNGDGTPTRKSCTNQLGNGLSSTYGRLDGFLVAVVPSTAHGCNADVHHLHLQVLAGGQTYDVAIDILSAQSSGTAAEVLFTEKDAPLAGGAWAEGWHAGSGHLDYPTTFGEHASAFVAMTEPTLEAKLEAELATVNHISVYGTGYGPDGMHDVHRKGAGTDGAIALQPTTQPHYLLFHFSNQSF